MACKTGPPSRCGRKEATVQRKIRGSLEIVRCDFERSEIDTGVGGCYDQRSSREKGCRIGQSRTHRDGVRMTSRSRRLRAASQLLAQAAEQGRGSPWCIRIASNAARRDKCQDRPKDHRRNTCYILVRMPLSMQYADPASKLYSLTSFDAEQAIPASAGELQEPG